MCDLLVDKLVSFNFIASSDVLSQGDWYSSTACQGRTPESQKAQCEVCYSNFEIYKGSNTYLRSNPYNNKELIFRLLFVKFSNVGKTLPPYTTYAAAMENHQGTFAYNVDQLLDILREAHT